MKHHANLLVGERTSALSCISEEDKKVGPDVRYYETERMSIDNVRELIHDTLLKPVERQYCTFIVITNSILAEAQNALLKLFEEPNEHTIFYFIVPHDDMLLPTLRSRLNPIEVTRSAVDETVFKSFIKAIYRDRLDMVGKHLMAEDYTWVRELVHGAEQYASKTKNHDIMKNVLLVSMYIDTPGSSKKMLLEHLALTL